MNQLNNSGNREGYWEIYFHSGKLQCKGNYINLNGIEERDGYWETYFSNGNLFWKGYYKNGVRIGYGQYHEINSKYISEKRFFL